MSVVTSLELNKFNDNELIITIKKSKTLIPIVIDPQDTFSMHLIKLSDNTKVATIDNINIDNIAGYISITDANNGKITIHLKEDFINSLETKKGSASDNYYSIPTYKILISAVTVDNGKITVKIDNVKVD